MAKIKVKKQIITLMLAFLLIGIATAGILITRNQELEKTDFVEWGKLDIGNPTIKITETENRIKIKIYKEEFNVSGNVSIIIMKPRYGFISKFNKTQEELDELILLMQKEILLKEINESTTNKVEPITIEEEIIIKEIKR